MGNLILSVEDGVGVLTVNRPEKLNALDMDTIAELSDVVRKIEEDDSVKCVIVIGAGEKAFIAGADISSMKELTPVEAQEFSRRGQMVIRAMTSSKKVYIAAVNGYALGGGFEVALGCDFIYASKNAKFGFPEVTLGILPGFGGTQNLPRVVGKGVARELILTGKMVDAEQAKDMGIVVEVKDSVSELLAFSKDVASRITKNGLLGVAFAKRAINDGFSMSEEEALRYENSLFGVVFSTEDAKEGLAAFVEKREPEFRNK